MKFFTLGYGGLEPQALLDLLSTHGVRTVADVRLRPDRASMGSYTLAKSADKGLQALLNRQGIGYQWLPELGNVFICLPNWRTPYAKLIEQSGQLSTERLSAVPLPFCLLCAEKNPDECHRYQIADYLVRLGHEVEHLKGRLAKTGVGIRKRIGSKGPWSEVDSIPGFSHYQGLLSSEDQLSLLAAIDQHGRWEFDSSRERQCHGYRYLYDDDMLEMVGDGELPDWLMNWARYIHERQWMSKIAQQVTIQKYMNNSYLGKHIDSRNCFGPELVTFSLVSACYEKLTNGRIRQQLVRALEPGDAVVLTGDARYIWKHEILKRKRMKRQSEAPGWRRLSITFRTIVPGRVRRK